MIIKALLPSPRYTGHDVTESVLRNIRNLLQQTFLWGYLKAQVFTHILPDINSLKNAFRQEIANVTQDTTSRHGQYTWEMAALLDCHGRHLIDVLKAWSFFFFC
jgi:hypothetical protein